MATQEITNNSSPELFLRGNGVIEDLPDYLAEGIAEREELLRDFARDFTNPDTWNHVANKALEEEALGYKQPKELANIHVGELISFAQQVFSASPEERYALTTQKASNGELWFDVLYGFHSPSGDQAIVDQVQRQLRNLGVEKVGHAVDLGTGTGNTASVLEPFAGHVTGLDNNPALLRIAQDKHPEIDFVHASVAALPFEDSSVDIITSDGLKHALDANTAVGMYEEIARVLKEGGIYIDTEWAETNRIAIGAVALGRAKRPDMHPELLKSMVTWRAALQDMIVDTISGKFNKTDTLPLRGSVWDDFKESLGFFEYSSSLNIHKVMTETRVLEKNAAKSAAEASGWRKHRRGIMDN